MRQGFVVLAVLAGCSDQMTGAKGNGGWDSAAYDSGMTDGDTGAEDSLTPVWWRLGATLVVQDGGIDATQSALEFTLASVDGLVICEASAAVSRASASVTTPDSVVLTWWRMVPEEPVGSCEDGSSPLPDLLYLGIGELHPDIEASLDPFGLSAAAGSLNGAYTSLDGGDTVYVYGVAGTEAAYAGEGVAADSAPLADGTWSVQAIYPFAYGS